MNELQRYRLKVVDRYAADGSGDISTEATMVPSDKGQWVAFQDLTESSAWISVADSLPAIGREVLVYVPSKIEMGRNPVTALIRLIRHEAASDFYWDNNYGGSNIHLPESVTYWMPLPEPPK